MPVYALNRTQEIVIEYSAIPVAQAPESPCIRSRKAILIVRRSSTRVPEPGMDSSIATPIASLVLTSVHRCVNPPSKAADILRIIEPQEVLCSERLTER